MSKNLPDQSNFIAIGAWNPAIIQPHWLKKQFPSIVPDNCAIEIASSGSGSSIRMNYEKVIIDPNNGRLILIPKALNEENLNYIKDLGIGIQSKLEHTPIVAAGSNFVFQLDSEEIFTVDDIAQDDKILGLYGDLPKQGKMISKSIRHTFGLADYSINVNYDYGASARFLRINYDYKGANPMKRAAESLIENYKYSLELCSSLIRKK